MALGATMHVFELQLADVDREIYADLSLRVAKHPSETESYMVTRVLAYCLEYEEGIAFGAGGVSSTEEPAVLVRDLSGTITAWIEVGAPDAQRLHYGSKLADRVAVYTHREPARLMQTWAGKTIYRAEDIVIRSFDRDFVDAVTQALTRRNIMSVSVTEGQLYLDMNETMLNTEIHDHRIG